MNSKSSAAWACRHRSSSPPSPGGIVLKHEPDELQATTRCVSCFVRRLLTDVPVFRGAECSGSEAACAAPAHRVDQPLDLPRPGRRGLRVGGRGLPVPSEQQLSDKHHRQPLPRGERGAGELLRVRLALCTPRIGSLKTTLRGQHRDGRQERRRAFGDCSVAYWCMHCSHPRDPRAWRRCGR